MAGYLMGVKQYNEGKTDRNLAILSNYTHLDQELLKQTCWVADCRKRHGQQATCEGICGLAVCK